MSDMRLYCRPAALVVLFCSLIVGACARGGTPADQPARTQAALATQPAPAASSAPASPVPALPTPAATITPAPPATPFPLAAGWWDNAVCYEVFVRSFYDSDGDGVGDLSGLIQKLDYINDGDPQAQKDLGATCIWLMPVMESPSYHGYDVVDYYKVDREYGTNDDFKRLVAEVHKRGIKVIVDLVLNHTSREHPWFQEALRDPASPHRDWYLWSKDKPNYKGPWGEEVWHRSPVRDEYYYGIFTEGMPDLNYRNPEMTQEARKISDFWLNQMGADGFRLDAIKHLIEDGGVQENTPETHSWLREYRAFLAKAAPNAYTIGEIFDANTTTLAAYYPDQLDMYFLFDIGKSIIDSANAGSGGVYALMLQRAYSRLPFQRWAPFLTNHDQDRAMALLRNDPSRARIAATALLTLPGMPFIYYGEEIGMFGAKPDEQIRTPMQWAGEEHGGFTSGRPWEPFQPNYTQVNVAAQDDDPDSLLNLYRRLVHLHAAHPALGHGGLTPLPTSSKNVVAFVRQAEDEAILVVLNFGKEPADRVALSVERSELAPGSYQPLPLLGDRAPATLPVGANGAIADYAPLATLAPRTGYIFKLK